MIVPTPHNSAKKGDIAKTVLMPGDPLRAEYIANKYLENVTCYNKVRNMLGFTGEYKGKRISVQGSGMGVPSMAIYSKELFEGYDVDNIIRIGSAGSLSNDEASDIAKEVKLKDILVAKTVDTDSNYIFANEYDDIFPAASINLLRKLEKIAYEKDVKIKVGEIYTSDTFYMNKDLLVELSKLDIIGVEMETLALYVNAALAGKNAIALFTVSDNIIKDESISAKERENNLDTMIELALQLAYKCEE